MWQGMRRLRRCVRVCVCCVCSVIDVRQTSSWVLKCVLPLASHNSPYFCACPSLSVQRALASAQFAKQSNDTRRLGRSRDRAEARALMPLSVKRSTKGKAQLEAMKASVLGWTMPTRVCVCMCVHVRAKEGNVGPGIGELFLAGKRGNP
jgi:hypothetical protein